MTAREAMAYGRPVVATRVGGLADLEGVGVELVEPRQPRELRLMVGRILRDAAGEASIADAIRARAEALFSQRPSASRLADVYGTALR
jgi:glycosyltransferase involved in cell wall biosynthesis